ncbi:hypothetical protein [Thermostichus vulcanus]|uniref:Uncharacterized protein n=1 Tax=Thermostichus vulcanus str. 'Rupite' TaxID=2813851 RepID=A0ABT0C723_THEVL|nr:hypothetical protein [Thermostichus vulcanus]MCJ2541561.1 hypothetical protein [Thermostichus vulcanus str. 'Rupite']
MTFDPRTLAKPVYSALSTLSGTTRDDSKRKEQKNQAVELYTYLSTWGLIRLKAEEKALQSSKPEKVKVIQEFFDCLQAISGYQNLSNAQGLDTLTKLSVEDYLGLTGLGLAIAQEFSFWATAIYHDVTGGDS